MRSWVVPILPYIDNQELSNQWSEFNGGSAAVAFSDPAIYGSNVVSNLAIGSTDIGVLVCPDDNTIVKGQGNLSYVVNGGFTIYHAWGSGWTVNSASGTGGPTRMPWAVSGSSWATEVAVSRLLGVFFPESVFPQGVQVKVPWNLPATTSAGLVDGASNTLMISENTLTGVSSAPTLLLERPPDQLGQPDGQLHVIHRWVRRVQ